MKKQVKNHNKITRTEEATFSPSELMRNYHPDLFSDSVVNQSINLSREFFAYHLDTLTSRKQELEFEHFCRRLAEIEICPNLVPQTGPIGGGDSQVDAETYPVSDTTALCWYEGIGREASSARWAFAFSAKKKWKPKAESDIEKIVNTKRDYKLAYFITNQFIKDKTRSEEEKSLSDKFGIEVRILDRTWITTRVFDHDRLWLAIETLNITGYKKEDLKRIGPKDAQREAWLAELEKQISNPDRYPGVQYQKVEDCFEAALVARELELPRVDVEGRFRRAIENAEQVNIREQKLHIKYNYAWTEYWWYEDYESFNRLYDDVEKLVGGTAQADDIELLVYLWQNLQAAARKGLIKADDANLSIRTQNIIRELDRLIGDEKRPNNSLQAQTLKLLIGLTNALSQNQPTDQILEGFKDVFKESEGLPEYPITPTMKIIQELGTLFSNSPKYDELLQVACEVIEKRASEGQAGMVLFTRGKQQIISGNHYEAIKNFGRAQQKLAKDEYKADWITSIILCGIAYEKAGLFWAARTNLLMAASQAFTEFTKTGKLNPTTLRCIQKLVWLEVKLGRLPCALSWIELSFLALNLLVLNDDLKKDYQDERITEDRILAILLIKTDYSVLKYLDNLPAILDKMGLQTSWMTLLYALGYEELLKKESVIPQEEDSDSIRDLFRKLYEQPVGKELPDHPDYLTESMVRLVSPVLGCKVTVITPNNNSHLFLAENIIGSLEAFLATSFDSDLIPYRSELEIRIETSEYLTNLPEYSINSRKQGEIIIRCPKEIQRTSPSERAAYRDWLQELITDITCQIVVIPNVEPFVERVIKNERSYDRAIIFSDVEVLLTNIFGNNLKVRLSDWNKNQGEKYPVRREAPLSFSQNIAQNSLREEEPIKLGEDAPPETLGQMDKLSHKDRKVVSLINIPLWDLANWQGMGFMCDEHRVPILALGFKNPDAASQIFSEWREKLGEVDDDNKLRVAIITGISKKNPFNYKVLLTANIEKDELMAYNHIISTSRFLEMYPQTPTNLQVFLSAYKEAGRFVLAPATMNAELNYPEPIGNHYLGKYHLIIRPAWEIGPNDPDALAIQPGDDPIIPDEEKNAPVIRALKRFTKGKSRKRHK